MKDCYDCKNNNTDYCEDCINNPIYGYLEDCFEPIEDEDGDDE